MCPRPSADSVVDEEGGEDQDGDQDDDPADLAEGGLAAAGQKEQRPDAGDGAQDQDQHGARRAFGGGGASRRLGEREQRTGDKG